MKKQLTILGLAGVMILVGLNSAKAQEMKQPKAMMLNGKGAIEGKQMMLKGDNLRSAIKQSGPNGLVAMMTNRLNMILDHKNVPDEIKTKIETLKSKLQSSQPFENKATREEIKTLWQDILKSTNQLRKEARSEKALKIFSEVDAHMTKITERAEKLKSKATDNEEALTLVNKAIELINTAKTNLATAKTRATDEDLEGLRKFVKESIFDVLKEAHKNLQSAHSLLKGSNGEGNN